MVCVYKALSPADADMVRHWLERNDIPACVRGGLHNLRSQIPMGKPASPTVWVDDALEDKARRAIELFQRPQLIHPQWECPSCDEVNEANFGSCWSCQADQPRGIAS